MGQHIYNPTTKRSDDKHKDALREILLDTMSGLGSPEHKLEALLDRLERRS